MSRFNLKHEAATSLSVVPDSGLTARARKRSVDSGGIVQPGGARINRALTDAAIAVLRFDFTGLGESEGEFADTNFSWNARNLVAAAADIVSSRAVAMIGAPCEPGHVEKLLGDTASIERAGEAEVSLAGRVFRIKRQFLDDLEESRMTQRIRTLKRALLVLHAPTDAVVGIENAAHIFHSVRHPKSLISLDGADHLLMRERDSLYAGSVIAAWTERYIRE